MISERDLYRRAFDTVVGHAPVAPDFDLLGTVHLTAPEPAKKNRMLAVAVVAAFILAVSPLIFLNNGPGPASPGTTPGVGTTAPCPTTTTIVGLVTTTTIRTDETPPPNQTVDPGIQPFDCHATTTTVGLPTSTMPPATTTTMPSADDGSR